MEVSTKLFNAQAIKNFSKINEEIQDTQAKIASGKSFLKASDDPVTAANLSAKTEQKILLDRFVKNSNTAKARLDLADSGLNQVISVLTRFSELSIQAANDTNGVDDRLAMVKEMEELSTLVLEITNTQDANGKSIFAGFKAATSAFNKKLDGSVEYVGDRGKHALQVSENMKVVSGLDGGTVFGSIKTNDGRKSIFEIIQNSINAAKTASQVSSKGTAPAKAELDLAVSRNPQNWSFDIEGSVGKVNISKKVSEGSLSNLKDEINLYTAQTGIIATYDETSKKITLSEKFAGEIVVSNLNIEGVTNASSEPEFYMQMESIDGEGNKIGFPRQIVDKDQIMSTSVGDIKKSINHISNQLAFIGAQTRKTDQQLNFLGERLAIVTTEVSELGDADLTKLVTDLQATIVNRDAAQAAFVKIGQQSLFDFLR
jgi:flagellar hook-associated protein 3 FlgL